MYGSNVYWDVGDALINKRDLESFVEKIMYVCVIRMMVMDHVEIKSELCKVYLTLCAISYYLYNF